MNDVSDFYGQNLEEVAKLYSAAIKSSDEVLAATMQEAARCLAMAHAEASYASVLLDFAQKATTA